MPEKKYGDNMILTKGTFNGHPTFSLIPATEDCPYIECFYDPQTKVFVTVSKQIYDKLHMLPKLDANGDIQYTKGRAPRPNGKNYCEERKAVSVFKEFYIDDNDGIREFVEIFAVNLSTSPVKIDDFLNAAPVSSSPLGVVTNDNIEEKTFQKV